MKTKESILILDNIIEITKREVPSDKLQAFNYVFLRNQLRFKPVLKEKHEIIKLLSEQYAGGDKEKQEEVDSLSPVFIKYIEDSDEFKNFLKEEVDIEYFTVHIDKLENVDFHLSAVEALLGTIVVE